MKKKLLICTVVLLFSGCTVKYNGDDPNKQKIPPIETVMNLAGNGVVMEKAIVDSTYYFILVRYRLKTDQNYYLKNFRVPKYEYDKFNIGDTIQ